MPKLPVLKPKELVRLLEKLGFYQHQHKGTSHLIMKHSDGRRTTIPLHQGQDIPKGTLKAILRDIEISTEEIIKLRQK